MMEKKLINNCTELDNLLFNTLAYIPFYIKKRDEFTGWIELNTLHSMLTHDEIVAISSTLANHTTIDSLPERSILRIYRINFSMEAVK